MRIYMCDSWQTGMPFGKARGWSNCIPKNMLEVYLSLQFNCSLKMHKSENKLLNLAETGTLLLKQHFKPKKSLIKTSF